MSSPQQILRRPRPLAERLQYLGEILISFSTSPVPSHVLQTLADYAMGAIDYDYLALALVLPEGEAFWVHHLGGVVSVSVPPRLYTLDEGCLGQVIRSGRPLTVPDLAAYDPATADLEGEYLRAGLKTALIIPLRQGENKIGALLFGIRPPTLYTAEDVQIASLLASGLSANLEMARLYQTLADERTMLTAVLESTADGFLVINPEGLILLANPALAHMFGQSPAQMSGQPMAEAIPHPAFYDLLAAPQRGTAELKLTDGRIWQARIEPLVSGFGENIGWAIVVHDITLLKELAHMKDEFVNTVSHDLKNPITNVLLAADLMERAGPLNDQQSKLRLRLIDTANFMTELVTDLLDLGRIEAGLGLEITHFNIIKLTREVLFALGPNAEDKQISLHDSLPESHTLWADRKRLRQALFNLIGNAIKYTPPQGSVTIWFKPDAEGGFQMGVQDTGLGIPTADLPHIFEKFYRVHTAATADIKGTGLGLAITKSIVDAHRGTIRVESEEGQGSTFILYLPQGAMDGWETRTI